MGKTHSFGLSEGGLYHCIDCGFVCSHPEKVSFKCHSGPGTELDLSSFEVGQRQVLIKGGASQAFYVKSISYDGTTIELAPERRKK